MAEDENGPGGNSIPAQECSPTSYDYLSFTNFMTKVVIEPFGGRLFQ